MMTKTTSAASAWLTRLAIVPVMAAAFMLFCNSTGSTHELLSGIKANHTQPDTIQHNINLTDTLPKGPYLGYPSTKEGASAALLDEYKSIVNKYLENGKMTSKGFNRISPADKSRLVEIFKQMNPRQQREQYLGFMYPARPLPQASPTQGQLSLWKDAVKYGVWIDDKRIKNAELDDYKPKDFGQVFVSRLTKIAIANDGFRIQVDLMTLEYYKKYRKEAIANRHKSIIYFRYFKMPGTKV